MKKLLSILLSVLMLLSIFSLTTSAEETYSGNCGAEGDNITWEIDVNTGTLYINGTGDMADYAQMWDAPWYSYKSTPGFNCVEVGEGITSIGDNAFSGVNVVKITISSTVKELGVCSFRGGYDTNIVINEENPYLKIDDYGVIFSKNEKTLICATRYISGDYEVPKTVEAFAPYAFSCSGNPYELNIPASIKSIPVEAFFSKDNYGARPKSTYPRFSVDENNPYYSNDEYGVLFDKNKEILYMAPFWDPYASEQLRYFIPETVRRIGDYAFFGYDKESILITENVTEIGSLVFCPFSEKAYGFTRQLYIPKTVTTLAEDFFINEEFNTRLGARAYVYYEGTQEEWESVYKGNKEWIIVYYEHEHANTIVEETCTQRIYTCGGCETVNKIENISDNHDWREINRGLDDLPCLGVSIYYSCNNCQAEKIEQGTPAEEHQWGVNDYNEGAYCVGGMIYYYCTYLCGTEKVEYVEGKGHQYQLVSNHDATCTEDGTKHEVCSRCEATGETVVDVESKLGHDLTETTVLSQTTCTQDGISVQACKRCAEIVATIEGAYGHFDNDGDGKCDECKVVLEVILPEVPAEPETDVTPEDPEDTETPDAPQESTNFFAKIMEFFNKIINMIKSLFGM